MLYQDVHSIIVLIALFLTLADYTAAFFAPNWYFKTGIPVIRRDLGAQHLTAERLVQWVSKRVPHRIFIRFSASSRIGLREHFGFYFLYSALLHWQLRPPTGQLGWVLVGRYKVYAIAYCIVVIADVSTLSPPVWFSIAFIVFGVFVNVLIIGIQLLHVRFLNQLSELPEAGQQ